MKNFDSLIEREVSLEEKHIRNIGQLEEVMKDIKESFSALQTQITELSDKIENTELQNVIMLVLTIIFSGLSLYLKARKGLMDKAKDRIIDAELKYKDTTNTGGKKFNWVVDTLYSYVPAPLKLIFSKELYTIILIATIVQRTFNTMEDYAKTQVGKIVDKVVDKQDE